MRRRHFRLYAPSGSQPALLAYYHTAEAERPAAVLSIGGAAVRCAAPRADGGGEADGGGAGAPGPWGDEGGAVMAGCGEQQVSSAGASAPGGLGGNASRGEGAGGVSLGGGSGALAAFEFTIEAAERSLTLRAAGADEFAAWLAALEACGARVSWAAEGARGGAMRRRRRGLTVGAGGVGFIAPPSSPWGKFGIGGSATKKDGARSASAPRGGARARRARAGGAEGAAGGGALGSSRSCAHAPTGANGMKGSLGSANGRHAQHAAAQQAYHGGGADGPRRSASLHELPAVGAVGWTRAWNHSASTDAGGGAARGAGTADALRAARLSTGSDSLFA